MTTAEHVDFDKKVVDFFNETGQLHPGVFDYDSDDPIKELIDAIPEENKKLLDILRSLL